MIVLIYLIPASIALGAIGLVAFLWSLHSGQYQDLDGAGERILYDEEQPAPISPAAGRRSHRQASASGPRR